MKKMFRPIFTALGALLALIEPTLPYIIICTLAIFYDCYTAWQLDRRVKAKYGDKAPKNSGKFRSSNAGRVIHTLIKVYALIILAYFINLYIDDHIWSKESTRELRCRQNPCSHSLNFPRLVHPYMH